MGAILGHFVFPSTKLTQSTKHRTPPKIASRCLNTKMMRAGTNNAMTAPTALGSLAQLPKELRDEIYHLVLCPPQVCPTQQCLELGSPSTDIVRSHGTWPLTPTPQRSTGSHGWLAILQVSKAINAEAMEHIYLYKTFLIRIDFQCGELVLPHLAVSVTRMKNVLFEVTDVWSVYMSQYPGSRINFLRAASTPHRIELTYHENMGNLGRAMTDHFGGASPLRDRCMLRCCDLIGVYENLPSTPIVQALKTLNGFRSVTLEITLRTGSKSTRDWAKAAMEYSRGNIQTLTTEPRRENSEALTKFERIRAGLDAELEPFLGPSEAKVGPTSSTGMCATILVFHPQAFREEMVGHPML